MIPFAVSIEGVTEEGTAFWVLAVEGERFLVSGHDRVLRWVPMAECRFARLVPPDAPMPVFTVPPNPQNGGPPIILPNRAERRRLERGL